MIDIFSYLYLISKIPVKVTFGCLHWQLPEILEVNVTVQIWFFSDGEMAVWIKYLLCKHKDLSLDP